MHISMKRPKNGLEHKSVNLKFWNGIGAILGPLCV